MNVAEVMHVIGEVNGSDLPVIDDLIDMVWHAGQRCAAPLEMVPLWFTPAVVSVCPVCG